jgi:phytoene dehydrogenase-like protein
MVTGIASKLIIFIPKCANFSFASLHVGLRDSLLHLRQAILHKRDKLMKDFTHGLSHNLFQLGYFRPRNRHPAYHNLYFVGASTHPGMGMPTTMVSARLTAQRIMDDLGMS